MKRLYSMVGVLVFSCVFVACGGGQVVQVTTVSGDRFAGLSKKERARLEEIQAAKREQRDSDGLNGVIRETPNYTVVEYLTLHPDANNAVAQNYVVGGYDVLDITVYEEEDLSRREIRVSANGDITFPLIGRLRVDGLGPLEIETLISQKLAEGGFILDAHVSVTIREFKSKTFMVLGSVKVPGSYPLQARERVLDAMSRAGGIDFEQGGKEGMIIRTENPNTLDEKKIVIRIELTGLLKGGDQLSNLLLADKDLLYIPKAGFLYIIGEVQKPGSYPYLEKEITIVEAISKAGGFTPIAARNKTRIIRVEDGVEKIITVNVDAITKSGRKGQDVLIVPGDVIVVPESFF